MCEHNCKGHDAAAVGEYWSLLWVTEELYESVPLRRCTTITWDGGEDRCLPRRCCKDRQITQQRQSDDLCASEQGAQLILPSCVLGSLVLVQLFLACSTDRKMVLQKRESFCANLMSSLTWNGWQRRIRCRRDLHSLFQCKRQQVVKLSYLSAPCNLFFEPLTAQKWSTEIFHFLNM